MLNGLKDMGKLLKQAQEMKAQMKKIQKELRGHRLEIENAGGKIKIIINGEMEFEDITLDAEYLKSEHPVKIEKALKEACNKAVQKSKDLATKKLGAVTGGMNIPGLT